MTGAAVVTGGASVAPVVTVVLPPVGGWLVTPVVFGVVSVSRVVSLGSVGIAVFAVVLVTPEVVAEGLELLACPVGFTVLLPGVVDGEGVVDEAAVVVAVLVEVG